VLNNGNKYVDYCRCGCGHQKGSSLILFEVVAAGSDDGVLLGSSNGRGSGIHHLRSGDGGTSAAAMEVAAAPEVAADEVRDGCGN